MFVVYIRCNAILVISYLYQIHVFQMMYFQLIFITSTKLDNWVRHKFRDSHPILLNIPEQMSRRHHQVAESPSAQKIPLLSCAQNLLLSRKEGGNDIGTAYCPGKRVAQKATFFNVSIPLLIALAH